VAFNATQQMGQRPSKMVQLFFAEALSSAETQPWLNEAFKAI
jgi:hypothetical protein